MIGYIYKITNEITNQNYVGQTIDINRRKKTHLSMLRNNNHYNPKLQASWNRYGEENFSFVFWTFENITPEQLDELECEYIEKYNGLSDGFNLVPGGGKPPLHQKVNDDDVATFLCIQQELGDGYGKSCEEIFGWAKGTASKIKRRLGYVKGQEIFDSLSKEEQRIRANDFADSQHLTEVALKRQLTQGGCAKAYQLTQNDFNFAFAVQELGFGYTPVANYLGVKPTTVKDWFSHRSRGKEYNLYLSLSQDDKENLFKEVKEANLTTYDCMKGLKYNQDDILNYLCYKKVFNGKDSLVQNLFGWAEGTCYSIRRPGTYKVIKAKFDALPAEEIQRRANLINLAVDKSRN